MLPLLVILRGLPGSGKSHIAEYISQNIPIEIIDPDKVDTLDDRYVNFIENINVRRNKTQKYRYNLHQTIQFLLNSNNVIWVQPWRNVDDIFLTLDLIKKNVDFNYLILEIATDPSICWKQRKDRFKNKSAFNRYIRKFMRIENCPNYIKLDSSCDPSEILTLIKSKV